MAVVVDDEPCWRSQFQNYAMLYLQYKFELILIRNKTVMVN